MMRVLRGAALLTTAVGLAGANAGADAKPSVVVERGIVYGYAGERALHLDLCRPLKKAKKRAPAVVWIHGGGWEGGSKNGGLQYIVSYAERGYVAVSVEYRLSKEAIFPAQIHDCKAAVRFLRAHAKKYGIDPDRIGAGGYSAGGHLAALLGTSGGVKELEGTGGWPEHSSRIQAVSTSAGPSDFLALAKDKTYLRNREKNAMDSVTKLLGGPLAERMELAKQASPIAHITPDDPPFLIVHGTKDELVPYYMATRLHEALKRNGTDVELVPLDGGSHVDWRFWSWETLLKEAEFFDRHLKAVR